MNFSDEQRASEDKADKLRAIERQFNHPLDDWHFALNSHMEHPIKTFSFFKGTKKAGQKIYFNGATRAGIFAYDWVKSKYIGELMKAFGPIEIILAYENKVIRFYNPLEGKKA